jgi:hypothetical protein
MRLWPFGKAGVINIHPDRGFLNFDEPSPDTSIDFMI